MTLTTTQASKLARGIASLGGLHVARIPDVGMRALAQATLSADRAAAVAGKRAAADAFADYLASLEHYDAPTLARVDNVMRLWKRGGIIRAAIRQADASARAFITEHKHAAAYDATRRAFRLETLARLNDAHTANVGAFPLSRADMRATDASRFARSIRAHWHTYTGGKHRTATPVADVHDVLQSAFVHAIESGDTVNGIPTFGAMYRHARYAAESAARDERAAWHATRARLLGHTGTDSAYPDADDKHSMRKLGTLAPALHPSHPRKHYGTRDTHAAAMADAERDSQTWALLAEVTRQARAAAVSDAAETFGATVATLVLDGVTLADIAAASGLSLETVTRRAAETQLASGVSEYSAHDVRRDERIAEADAADSALASWMVGEYWRRVYVVRSDNRRAYVPLTRPAVVRKPMRADSRREYVMTGVSGIIPADTHAARDERMARFMEAHAERAAAFDAELDARLAEYAAAAAERAA